MSDQDNTSSATPALTESSSKTASGDRKRWAIVITVLVFVILCGLTALYFSRGDGVHADELPAIEAPVAEVPVADAPPVVAEEPVLVAPAVDEPVAEEPVVEESAPSADESAESEAITEITPVDDEFPYTYISGGNNIAWEGGVEEIDSTQIGGEDGWLRVRQAANGQFLAWVSLFRFSGDLPMEGSLQFDSATKFFIVNATSDVRNYRVEICRDSLAPTVDANPYLVANAQNSPLGLGWFINGIGAEIVVNGSDPLYLTGLGVYQLSFPQDWTNTWVIDITLQPNSQVTFNQGERWTEVDNWTLPNEDGFSSLTVVP